MISDLLSRVEGCIQPIEITPKRLREPSRVFAWTSNGAANTEAFRPVRAIHKDHYATFWPRQKPAAETARARSMGRAQTPWGSSWRGQIGRVSFL